MIADKKLYTFSLEMDQVSEKLGLQNWKLAQAPLSDVFENVILEQPTD
jgi:hypothetical protein